MFNIKIRKRPGTVQRAVAVILWMRFVGSLKRMFQPRISNVQNGGSFSSTYISSN
jgi:hypothetical protein